MRAPRRLAVAADHNGVALKDLLIAHLVQHDHSVEDLGSRGAESTDYPPLCAAVCERVRDGRADVGIVVGGTGQGEVIACNKFRGIRAGLAYSRLAVEVSRGNNNANVMVLGTKVVSTEQALELVELWLSTPFKGGVHQRRIDQISQLEADR